jgi:hypothetical protein
MLRVSERDHRHVEEFDREHRAQKGAFFDFMKGQRRNLMTVEPGKPSRIELAPDARRSFREYFEAHAVWFARDLAERAGVLPAVQSRGVNDLLDLPSVRMAVGASLSLPYSQIIENQAPRIGDSRDVHHAIAASVAEVFVTHDGPLAERLRQIPTCQLTWGTADAP